MAARAYRGLRAQGMVGDGWMPTEGDVFSRIFVCEVDPPLFFVGREQQNHPKTKEHKNSYIQYFCLFDKSCLIKSVDKTIFVGVFGILLC